jgi:uncharacterized membrane protein YagU involved in acid resistance
MAGGRRRWDAATIDRILVPGILAGMTAAIPMGLFAMIAAATYQHRGFYTPLYQIASLLGDDTLGASVRQAARGEPFYFVPEPVVFGASTHLMVGAFFGAVFAVVTKPARSRSISVLTGIVYGLVVMLAMGLVVVPAADAVLGRAERLQDLPSMAGWWTFTFQHVIYGLVLGWWPWLRRPEVRERPSPSARGQR